MKNNEWKTIHSFWEDLLCHVCFRVCKQWLMIDSEGEKLQSNGICFLVCWCLDPFQPSLESKDTSQNKKALLMDYWPKFQGGVIHDFGKCRCLILSTIDWFITSDMKGSHSSGRQWCVSTSPLVTVCDIWVLSVKALSHFESQWCMLHMQLAHWSDKTVRGVRSQGYCISHIKCWKGRFDNIRQYIPLYTATTATTTTTPSTSISKSWIRYPQNLPKALAAGALTARALLAKGGRGLKKIRRELTRLRVAVYPWFFSRFYTSNR